MSDNDVKISDLSTAGTITGAELVPVVQSGNTVKIPVSSLGFSRISEGPLSLLDPRVGCDPTGAVDCGAQINSAIATLLPARGGRIYAPPGLYRLSTKVTWSSKCVIIEGAGSGLQPSIGGTEFRCDAGVAGFHFLNGSLGRGARSGLMHFHLTGQDAVLGTNDGVLIQANSAFLQDLCIERFGRHGVNIDSSTNITDPGTDGGVATNANHCYAHHIRLDSNHGSGWTTYGVNANAGAFTALDCAGNGGAGIYERSFLGNTYTGIHLAGNLVAGIRLGNPGSRSHLYGVYYEAQNAPAIQIDAGNSGSNICFFTTGTRQDGASPILDNAGGYNMIYQEQGGAGFNQLHVKDPSTDTKYIHTTYDSLFHAGGASTRWQNPAQTANWTATAQDSTLDLVLTSAQNGALSIPKLKVISGYIAHREVASTHAGTTLAIDASAGDLFHITLNANITALSITNPTDGQIIVLDFKQDASGGRTVVFAANFKLAGSAFALTGTASTSDSLTLRYRGPTLSWKEISRSMNLPA